jgi:hypothetical protein
VSLISARFALVAGCSSYETHMHHERRRTVAPPVVDHLDRHGEAGDEVTYVALANSWIIINLGGGPTDDKPTVTLETPTDPDRVNSFLNIRVADIQAVYAEWSARGAHFLTRPKQHETEIRCYIRDLDGYLIEVGPNNTGQRLASTVLIASPM